MLVCLAPACVILMFTKSNYFCWKDFKVRESDIHYNKVVALLIIINCVGMWGSREMLRQDTDKQIVMKTTLRELIIYW